LRQAAKVAFANAPTVKHNFVANLKFRIARIFNNPGKIDARHHRKLAHDRRFSGDGKAIFII